MKSRKIRPSLRVTHSRQSKASYGTRQSWAFASILNFLLPKMRPSEIRLFNPHSLGIPTIKPFLRLATFFLSLYPFSVFADVAPKNSLQLGAFMPTSGGGEVMPTLLLPLHSKQPFACSAAVDGAIALTHLHRLCVCDGARWTTEANGAACSW
jgi:hypothetical protein